MKNNMFDNKTVLYFLMLLLVLIVGLGVSSAADIDTNSLEVNDNSTDLNVTTVSEIQTVSLENSLESQALLSDNEDSDSEDVSHAHKSLSSINKVPLYLNNNFDLITTISVGEQISNYLNYTVKVLDDSILSTTGPVTVTITIPGNLSIVSTLPPEATYSSGVITWTISSLLSGDNATLNFITNVTEAGFINVTANAVPSVGDTDVDLTNNYAESTMNAITYLSFTALKELIDAHTGPYLHIEHNYAYDYIIDGDKFGFIDGIDVNKSVYIINNGNFIISGANASKIFNVTAPGVTFDGLILTNGYSYRGAAITSSPSATGLRVTRSTFISNLINGDSGGAIFIGGNNSVVENSVFLNNTASSEGGAIGIIGVNGVNIINCTFDNNFVSSPSLPGGAISVNNSRNINITHNAIVNNRGRNNNGYGVFVSNVFNLNLNENWWGTNFPNFTNNRLVSGTPKPTSWVILKYELMDGSMTVATTRAGWYINNTAGVVTKLDLGLPTRSIKFDTNYSYFLSPDPTISSDTYASYFYGFTLPDQIFYLNTTVDNQTCVLEFTTVLNITKTVDPSVSVGGDEFQYNLTIINKGPSNAYNIYVTDIIPSGLILVNASDAKSISGNNILWNISVIAPNTTYTIPVTVKSNNVGTFTNRMNVSSTNKYNYFLNNITYVNHTVVPGVDLNITVYYDNSSYIGETPYYFNVTIHNNGPSTANGIEVYFKVPDGMDYITHTTFGWGTYDKDTGIWSGIGNLVSGGTRTLRIQANATKSGIFNGTANVTLTSASTVNETKLSNNYYNVSVYVSDNIDLNISIKVNTSELYYKSQVNVTVTVKNLGPAPAYNISAKIDLPTGLTYVMDNSTGLYNSTTGILNISSLFRNQQVTIYIICNADALGNFTINATVYNNTGNDTNLTNNYDELNITVIPFTDLSITINVTNTTPVYDAVSMKNITYTITVHNNGLNNATNVTVNFTLPAGLVYLEHTSGLDYNDTDGIWTVGDVLFNETKEINITVGVNATGNITVFTNVTGNENDTVLSNNTANISIFVTSLVDLTITKTVNITGTWNGTDMLYYANDGDNVTYTLIITNNGPCNATDVVVIDYITNLTNIVANASGIYSSSSKNITWNIGNLSAGQTVYVHFNATIKTIEPTLFNNATVTSNKNDTELNITDNIDNITLLINHYSDLEIILNISNTTPAFYDLVNLTVTVINHGPSIALDLNVTLEIPSELVHKDDNSSGAYNPSTKIWNIGVLNDNNQTSIWILFNVTSISNMTINGTVDSTINDTNKTNNNATVNLSSVYCDVEIIISVPNTNIAYDDLLNLTVTVINHGPSIALDLNVTLEIPSELVHKDDNSSGAYNPSTKIWNVGSLFAGSQKSIWILLNVTSTGNMTINATVNNTDNDLNITNNNATLNLSAFESANLMVTITTNLTSDSYMEDPFTIFVTVTNLGPSNATNVNVTINIPAGLTILGENSTGNYNPSTGIWNIGNLGRGETVKLHINVTSATAKIFYINATVNGSETDVNLTNNFDNVTINVIPVFDLIITVTPNFTKARVGDEITLIINVTNRGPSNATGVIVDAIIDSSFTGFTMPLSVGTVNAGETKLITFKLNATSLGDYIFFFNVTAPGNDSNRSNNNCTVNVSIVTEVDLLITIVVDNSTPTVWNNVTYTITVSNIAHSNATGVYVNVPLPSSLVYMDKYVASGEYNETSGLWYIGDLDEGNSTSIILTCRVVAPGTTVLEGVVDSYEFDVDLTNNKDSATINAIDAPLEDSVDLELNITVNNPTVPVGSDVVFTFNLTNKGPLNSTITQVLIEIPTGLTYVGASTSIYPINSTHMLWIVGDLNVNESVILNVTFNPSVLANLTISGNASSNEQEYNPIDNYANLTIEPTVAADLLVNITATTLRPFMDDIVTFTITVANIGLTDASGVIVRVDLPSGGTDVESMPFFTPVSAEGCGMWLLASPLAPGQVETLNITLNTSFMGLGFHNYHVNVSSTVYDTDSSNDKDNITIEVRAPSDLFVTITANVTETFTGDDIKFTVTVNNAGVGDAEDVYVYLEFPSSVTYTSTKGLFDTNKSIWKVGTLTPGEIQTLDVIFSLKDAGQFTFWANGTTTSLDTNLTNNNDSWNLTIKPDYDLTVNVTVQTINVGLGDTVIFTITVNNTGLTMAENVNVYITTTIPTAATLSGISKGNYLSVPKIWQIDNVSTGEVLELNLSYTVNTVGTYVLAANITASGNERNKTNNNDSAIINVTNAVDLIINITVNNETPSLGSNVIYTITVTNNGTNTATGIIIDKTFAGTPVPGYTMWVVWPMGMQCFITSLAPGASESISYTVPVTSAGLVTETVNVTSTEADSNLTNNVANVTINVSSATDLNITILVNNNTPYVGDIVNFTVIVSNIGSVNATGVIVTTNLPQATYYSQTSGAYNPNTGIWFVGSIANGSEAYLNVSVNITKLGFQVYNASVDLSNEDIDLSNNNDSVNLTSTALTDLEVLIIGNTSYYVGNSTSFTIFIINHGPNNATNVNVTLNLPEDTATPSKGTYSAGFWNVGTLEVDENATLTINRIITLSDNGIYTANITGDEFEYNTDNNNASINLTVNTISDLTVIISTDKTNYVYGEDIIYTITVINNGPSDIASANVTLDLPSPLEISLNLTTNGYYDNTTSTWYLTTSLNSGNNVTLTIKGNTTLTGDIISFANVTSDIYDDYLENNTSNCTYYIEPSADIYINMTTIPGVFNPDGSVGFVITVGNLGPSTAYNASVNLSFPFNVEYTSTTGYYDSVKGVWFIPTLIDGQVETLTVNINLTNFTQEFNGNITSDVYDPNMTNNFAKINLTVQPRADLMVTITANVTNITMGESIQFIVNVTNLGPCVAQGVEVYLNLPSSVDFDKTAGLFDTDNGKWDTFGIIGVGQSEYLYVNITFNDSGVFTYNVNVTGNVNDTVTVNNNDTITINVEPVTDLEITITSNFTEVIVGESVEFYVTVKNIGNYNDTNVIVKLLYPTGLGALAVQNYGIGFLNFPTLDTWTIPTLNSGDNATLKIQTTVLSNGTFNFTTTVNGTYRDINLTNNIASLIYNVTPTVDLKITINSTNNSQYLNENVTFTITVTNIGTNTAENVIVSTNVSKGTSVKTKGIFDSDSGLWYIGELVSGETVELNITVVTSITGNVTYIATVNSSSKDTDESNNNASINFTGLDSTDLEISVSVNNEFPYLNDIINYTIKVKNIGEGVAYNVNVSTNLTLNGFSFEGSDSGYNSGTGLWTVGDINPGETKVLTVRYKTNNSGTFTNSFNVSSDTYEVNLLNNDENITIIVNPNPRGNFNTVDLIIGLTVSNATPCVNNTIDFTVTVYNNGSIVAHDVVITNYLPATFVPVGSYGNLSNSGIWNFTELAPGDTITLNFTVNVTDVYGSYVDNVTVSSTELDSVPINNLANVLIVISEAELDCIDLEINATRVVSNLTVNGTLVYNITVVNYGPDMAFDVNASFNLNNGVGLVVDSWTCDVGEFNTTTMIWSIGDLDVTNATSTVIVSMLITLNITDAGYYVNHWSVWDDDVDLNPLNNNYLDIFWVNETLVDIGVRINANTTAPVINDTVLFEVTVYNSGTILATNVTVNLTLPNNMFNVTSADPLFNSTTLSYYVGDLASGSKVIFYFNGSFNSTSVAIVTVTVNSTEEDRYPDTNIDKVKISPKEPDNLFFADLEIVSMSVSDSHPAVGDTISLSVLVRNNGPDTAHNVVVSISYPDSCSVAGGGVGVDPITGIFTTAELASGANVSFTVSLLIVGADTFVVTESGYSDEIDTNSSNNVKSVGIASYIVKPDVDLGITVSASESTVNVNGTVTYTISVHNYGNDAAHNVSIKNTIPTGLVVDTYSDSVFYDGADGWFLNTLGAGATKTFTVKANVTDTGVLLFTTKVNCSEEDKDPTNNGDVSAIYSSLPVSDPVIKNTTIDLTVPLTSGKVSLNTGDKIVTALLKDADGNVLEGYNLVLQWNSTESNHKVLQATTDSSGYAYFTITSADFDNNQKYSFVVTFSGKSVNSVKYENSTSKVITKTVRCA